ncbi:natural killer cell receptor 2B4 [Octodon degus]|uniref:Natural killer cell receptor 2B4 n=1 Tax=Octodon degus TaxID=10160 RepID=A0A6P6D6T0_OCTDE|nr:natural killer cell receptor 2B4 [Octodon degus]XP_023555581.1 natural killer cell receptor 2B4 [Octodon degus]
MAMSWQTVTLTLLLLFKGHQGRGCSSGDRVVSLSGQPVLLRLPNTQTNPQTVEWKTKLPLHNDTKLILRLKRAPSVVSPPSLPYLNSTLEFKRENWSLLIMAAKPEYSGLYKVEITDENGTVFCIQFEVLIVDHVEKPHLHVERKVIDEGKCQAFLSCLASRNDHVSYAWYRDSNLILTSGNLSQLVVQIDANEQNTYTCNVSNAASWATESLRLTQGCLESRFWPLWVVIAIVVMLILSALTCFCVWKRKRKRKQSQPSPSEHLTVYEDIKEVRRNQYSAFTSQPSQETDLTLYSVIRGSQKTKCKKRNQDPSPICTIYDQVGSRPHKACNPARLSRRELENFEVHY